MGLRTTVNLNSGSSYILGSLPASLGGNLFVRSATVGNITLSGTQTVDGVVLIAGDKVLAKNQTTASQNGVYVVASGGWTRTSELSAASDFSANLSIFVSEGTINANSVWYLVNSGVIVVGSTSLNFAPRSMFATTIASLRSIIPNDVNAHINVLNYSVSGDGGGGIFYWDASSTAIDDSGTIITPTGLATGRWKRQINNSEHLNVRWFGAKGDGETLTGISITSGTNIFTKSGLTSLYIGKLITIDGAGTSGDILSTSILNVVGTTITTATNAITTVTNVSAWVGTNDTTSLTNAYLATPSGQEIFHPKGIYCTNSEISISIQNIRLTGTHESSILRAMNNSFRSIHLFTTDNITAQNLRYEGLAKYNLPGPNGSIQYGIFSDATAADMFSSGAALETIPDGYTLQLQIIDNILTNVGSGTITVTFNTIDHNAATGTFTIDGSGNLTGTSTAFLSELYLGRTFKVGSTVYTTVSVTDNTTATVTPATSHSAATAYLYPNSKVIDKINLAGLAIASNYDEICTVHPSVPSEFRLVSSESGPNSSVNIVGGTALTYLGLTISQTFGSGTPAQRCKVLNCTFDGPDITHRINNGVKIGPGCNDWTTENLILRLTGNSGDVGNGYGVLVGSVSRWKSSNIHMLGDGYGGRHCLYFAGGVKDSSATDIFVDGAYSNSISMLAYAHQPSNRRNTITGLISTNQQLGLDGSGCVSVSGKTRDTLITNCKFSNCARNGIIIQSLTSDLNGVLPIWNRNNVVNNITMNRIGQHGIGILGVTKVKVRNVQINAASCLNNGTYGAITINSGGNGAIADDIDIDHATVTHDGTPNYPNAFRLEPNSKGPTNVKIGSNCYALTGTAGSADGLFTSNTAIPIFKSTIKNINTIIYDGTTVSPSVLGIDDIYLFGSGSVGNLPDGQDGQKLRLKFDGVKTIIHNNGGGFDIRLSGGISFIPPANSFINLICVGTVWYEISRSFNSNVVAISNTLASYLSIGSLPATSGDIRLTNGFVTNFRNNANSANLGIFSTSGDTLTIGDFGTSHIRLFAGEVDIYSSSGVVGLSILDTAIYPAGNLRWVNTLSSPTVKQDDNTSNGGTGNTLTVQSQNKTGTTTTGGSLALTSGTGTTAAGLVLIQTGGTTRLTANASGVITIANLSTGILHADSSGNLTSSTIVNADVSGSAAIAGNKISPDFGSQNIVTTGFISLGTTPSTSGDVRLANGFSLNFRNNANGANLQALSTSGDTLTLNDFANGHIRLFSGGVDFYANSTLIFGIVPTAISFDVASLFWIDTITAPVLKQNDTTTNSATGHALTIQGQNATGTTTTGGNLVLTSGTGTTIAGNVNINAGGTNIVSITPSKFINLKGVRRNVTLVDDSGSSTYAVLTTDDIISVGTISGASYNVTLPSSPTTGDTYNIKDKVGTAATKNIIVSGNGSNIDVASTFTINQNYGSLEVVFISNIWSVI